MTTRTTSEAALDRQHQQDRLIARLEADVTAAKERAAVALTRHQEAQGELRAAQSVANDAASEFATARHAREEAERALRLAQPVEPRAVDRRIAHVTAEMWDAINQCQSELFREYDRLRGQDRFNPGDLEHVERLRVAAAESRGLPLLADPTAKIAELRAALRR